MQEQIKTLFYSFQEVNFALLLELIVGNHWLEDCASEILLVQHFSKEESTKARAQELLDQLAELGYAQAIYQAQMEIIAAKNGDNLIGNGFLEAWEMYWDEHTYILPPPSISEPSKQFCTKTLQIALGIYYQHNITEVLPLTNKEEEKALLKHLIYKECRLSLEAVKALPYFPSTLTSFENLAHINIHIKGAGHDSISNQELENEQFFLPEDLYKLKKLRLLHLHGGVVQNFPLAALQQLTNLDSLSFQTKQPVPLAALQEALPKCRLNVRTV